MAAVGIRCYRHEGIVLTNQQWSRGLGRLAATWELTSADGRTLTAPAELPRLRPGETAAVPLPFALPAGSGEMWLTLRVVTAVAEPRTPRGTQVCAARVRLLRTVPDRGVPHPSVPDPAVPDPAVPDPAVPPVEVDDDIDAGRRGPDTEAADPRALPEYRVPPDARPRSRPLRSLQPS
ncbi:DUF4981 domain-containing protein [Streptomyces alanosinicus]|uniref:DUF4981 domain-containing protein n=1 Tax=Streptomyces alanosinicus TaxID=68171 RepID=UPI0035714EEE